MDQVKLIYDKILKFIQLFMVKYEYENRGILKRMKIDSRLNMEIDDEEWCRLFLYKSCFNHCAKLSLLRILEDRGLIYEKINKRGIYKWNEFVQNISENYSLLYEIAIKDLQNDKNYQIRGIFNNSDYDVFKIDEELGDFIIKNLSDINFKNLNREDIKLLFQLIYSLEQREVMKLDTFYKEAPALSYILNL